VHTRVIAFVADRHWIVEDRLCGRRAHRYDLRFHLAPEALGNTHLDGRSVRAPGLGLVFAPGPVLSLERGWVAPSYGTKLEAPVVSGVVEGEADANFVTLVAPLAAGDPLPELTVRREGGRTRVEVDGCDPVVWSVEGGVLVVEAGGGS
jgi:hypothetical protein